MFVCIFYKMQNLALPGHSRAKNNGKELYKNVWCMSTVVVLLIKHILFFYILVTITLMNPKVPNVSCQTRGSDVIWRFDLGDTWMGMLDGRATCHL